MLHEKMSSLVRATINFGAAAVVNTRAEIFSRTILAGEKKAPG